MQKILVKLFIKNYKDTKSIKVREAYGVLCGIFGIVTNILLSILKIIVGLFAISPAIIADGINNLADSLSSVITLIGFKLSAKKADVDHPFGHQRLEYITGLIVSFLILLIGLTLLKESFISFIDLIKGNPQPLNMDNPYLVFGALVISIGVKCYQSLFYKSIAKIIDSEALYASSQDSLNDCITTSAVFISSILFLVSKGNINVDSIAGMIVSVFIIISSIGLIKDTVNPLLGEVPSAEETNKLVEKIKSYDGALGIHDLVFHSYGPNMKFVTIHVEVSREVDVMESHDLIDNIESDVRRELDIDLTIHMDPIEVHDEMTNIIKKEVSIIINNIDPKLTFHDFRIVPGPTHTNILFDVVIPASYKASPNELKQQIVELINKHNNSWHAVVNIDQLYISYREH